MSAGRAARAISASVIVMAVVATTFTFAGTAQAASGDTIPGAAAAQTPFTPGTFDSGQPINVVVPANTVLTPGATIFVLECAAPNGVKPTNISSCDGNTAYAGGTISVQSDGSIDVINTSTTSGLAYTLYALPDQITLGESPAAVPKCGLGAANECVLYIGQGGGSDPGLSLPHFFSQAFQVHPDPTDSGAASPGDGTFPADSVPAITSANHTTFTQGAPGTFNVTATGYGPPTFTETGALPTGVTLKTTSSLNTTTGVLAGTPTVSGSFPITIHATNGVAPDATQSFTLTVNGAGTAPAITSANHTTFTQGSPGTFTVTATGSPTPTLAETGSLPAGVTFTPGTGVLAGTPTVTGTFPITFTASNGVGSPANQSFTLTVNAAPTITSANNTTFVKGTAGTFTVTATGSPSPTFNQTGTLPTGVLFSSAGVLAGTPTQSGTFPITIHATNGVAPDAAQSFTLTVNAAPTITSANSTTFVKGTAGTFTVTATGLPAPTFTESGALPTGVTLTSAGVLAGTPAQSSSFPVTIHATNGVAPDASQSFTLTVNAAPVITSANLTTFTQGAPGIFTVTATGVPTPTFAESGVLPTGVTLTSAGVLAGTPTVSGTFPITIHATNGVAPDATQSFTLTVANSGVAPTITSANNATFTQGSLGTFTVTATGSPAPTFGETGPLPTGVTLNGGTGLLSGTPTVSGTFPITITATNGVGSPANQSFTLTVNSSGVAPTITSANATTFVKGSAGTFTVNATGSPAPTFSQTGTMPIGVLFSSAGVLAGTPTQSGSFPITIHAANGVAPDATQIFTLTVNAAPTITSATNTTFTQGSPGTFTVTATGFPAPTLAESGSPPAGVTFTPGTGVLAGTPTVTGSFPITFHATNGVAPDATQGFTLTVNAAPVITSANATTFTQGTAGIFTVTATGSPAPTFTETGALPGGISLTSAGALAGTPTQSGGFPITIHATNGVAPDATQSFTLTVNGAPAITSANHATFTQGTAGSFTVTATGNPAPTFSETGVLPAGVTLTSAGVLAGTPTASGSFPITVNATNGVAPDAAQSFTLTVNSPGVAPTITSANNTTFIEGSAGTFTVTATGTPPPTFTETGALPAGVTLTSAGVLGGTPTVSGTFPITIHATNGVAPDAAQSFTLTVNAAPSITSANSTTFAQGTAGSFTVTATGNPTPTFSESGSLPAGVTLTSAGVLAGTPTTNGSFPITIHATNGVAPDAAQIFTLTVTNSSVAPTITSANNTSFTQGAPGMFTVTATGSPTPTFTESGSLPGGVTLTSAGVLAGTPTQSGSFPVTITATNGFAPDATQSFTLTVAPVSSGPTVALGKSINLIGNLSDKISGAGWTGDTSVTLNECATTGFAASSCDGANQVTVMLTTGAAVTRSAHLAAGTFKNALFTLAVGVIDKHGDSCGLQGSGPCYLVVVGNTGDSAAGLLLGFSTPSFTAKKTLALPGNYVDSIKAVGFPIGDTVVARECDARVRVPATISTHCDAATEISGTAGTNGRVAFSAAGVQLLVGNAYSDAAGRKCKAGGTCEIVVADSSNPAIGLEVAVTFASPTVMLGKTAGVKANQIDVVKANTFPVGDTVTARQCDGKVRVPATISTHCDPATAIVGTAGNNGKVSFSPKGVGMRVGSSYADAAGQSCLSGGTCEIVVSDSSNPAVGVKVPVGLA